MRTRLNAHAASRATSAVGRPHALRDEVDVIARGAAAESAREIAAGVHAD
jgi:hypothetical protein